MAAKAGFGCGVILVLLLTVRPARADDQQWTQWGGPRGDFSIESSDLAESWPEGGPRQLWARPLGEGVSGILACEGRLYTLYRKDQQEYAVALDALTGATMWEHGWRSQLPSGLARNDRDFSSGPYSTPLLADGRLFAVGVSARMFCLEAKTGTVLWQHDLPQKFGGAVRPYGYAASPLACGKTVILPVDRRLSDSGKDEWGLALVALDQATGEVGWQSKDYRVDSIEYSSPILIEFAGKRQLVLRCWTDLVGFDPENGEELWRVGGLEHGEVYATPLWIADDLLLCSRYNATHLFKLAPRQSETAVREVWRTSKVGFYWSNAVSLGDYVCGTSGVEPAFLSCVDVRQGRVLWRERGFEAANCITADGKVILLDQRGELALLRITSEGSTMLAHARVLEKQAWTVPTLVGKTLYVRDRKRIVALDLG